MEENTIVIIILKSKIDVNLLASFDILILFYFQL